MIRRTLVAVAMAVAVLGLAGCKNSTSAPHSQPAVSIPATTPVTSSSPQPADSAPATAGCLINRAEASAALGSDAGAPTNVGFQCIYSTPAGNVTVVNSPVGGAQFFDGERSSASSTTGFRDVAGVGDRAFQTDGLLVFVKGANVVTINVTQSSIPTAAVMTALGQAAAGRV